MNLVIRENFFLLLFSFLPVSIILGSSISLTNIILINLFFFISFNISKKTLFC